MKALEARKSDGENRPEAVFEPMRFGVVCASVSSNEGVRACPGARDVMAKLVLWPAVAAIAVLAGWLINGVIFPSSAVPARQVVWTVIVVAVVAFAVAWRQRKRS
jgi:hypothetical protein